MQDEQLTFVINVRDGGKYIAEAIRSVLRQTIKCRIIVVNNQSTDNTREIALGFPGVPVFDTPHAMSLGEARNFSLNYVETAYVSWLDSDDAIEPDFSSYYLSMFRRYAHVGFVSGGCSLIDVNGIPLPKSVQRPYFYEAKIGEAEHTFGDCIQYSAATGYMRGAWVSYAFRTDLVNRVGGFDAKLNYAEDFDLILRLCRITGSLHLMKNISACRVHPDQLTQTLSIKLRLAEHRDVLTRALKEFGFTRTDYLKYLDESIFLGEKISITKRGYLGLDFLRELLFGRMISRGGWLFVYQKISTKLAFFASRALGFVRWEQMLLP